MPKEPTFFRSFLLKRDVELTELYELEPIDLDMIITECQTIREDKELVENPRLKCKWLTAGYFLNLAQLVDSRRMAE